MLLSKVEAFKDISMAKKITRMLMDFNEVANILEMLYN